jgi:hypothetical protein
MNQNCDVIECSTDIIAQLAENYCNKWFDDPGKGSVDIFIYPVVGITVQELRSLVKLELPEQRTGWKGILVAADIQNLPLLDITARVQLQDGETRIGIPSEVIRELLFAGPSIIIAFPSTSLPETNPIALAVSLFRLYRGSAIAWGRPIGVKYNRQTQDKWIAMHHSKPYCPSTDGPFDSPLMGQNISETLSALVGSENSHPDRAIFALELFNQANESIKDSLGVRIFHYWSAIETLCDSNKESDLLGHLFDGKSDKTAPENRKLFGDARTLRHNVIHKGYAPFSDPHILERYLQVVFLDMLRNILKLPYAGYIEQFTNRHGTVWFQEKYKKKK